MLGPSSAGPLLAEAAGLEGAGGMGAAGAKKGSAPEEAVEAVSCSRPEKRSAGNGKEPELTLRSIIGSAAGGMASGSTAADAKPGRSKPLNMSTESVGMTGAE